LIKINTKISSLPKKIRNNQKYKDILDYLETKIKLEIIKRELNENIYFKKVDENIKVLSCDKLQNFIKEKYNDKTYIWNGCSKY